MCACVRVNLSFDSERSRWPLPLPALRLRLVNQLTAIECLSFVDCCFCCFTFLTLRCCCLLCYVLGYSASWRTLSARFLSPYQFGAFGSWWSICTNLLLLLFFGVLCFPLSANTFTYFQNFVNFSAHEKYADWADLLFIMKYIFI